MDIDWKWVRIIARLANLDESVEMGYSKFERRGDDEDVSNENDEPDESDNRALRCENALTRKTIICEQLKKEGIL